MPSRQHFIHQLETRYTSEHGSIHTQYLNVTLFGDTTSMLHVLSEDLKSSLHCSKYIGKLSNVHVLECERSSVLSAFSLCSLFCQYLLSDIHSPVYFVL